MSTHDDLFLKMAIDSWQSQVKLFNDALSAISDEELMQEIAPTRNRGIYLLGHMVAIHDLMLPLLRFEKQAYPELRSIFIDAPDKMVSELPPSAQLRQQWHDTNNKLMAHFSKLSVDEWMQRHNSVSEEDFAKQPHRNRLNVLLSRTSHAGYHAGQLVLLVRKK